MRLLHTADWHIGKRLQGHHRLREQREVLNEIIAIADQREVDLVLVAGDLFDTFNPSAEAQDLLYDTLKRLSDGGKRPVVAIAGNHDDPAHIEAQDHFGRECGILFAGYPKTEIKAHQLACAVRLLCSAPGFVELQLPNHDVPVRILLTPYANEARFRAYMGMDQPDAELRDQLHQHWQSLANTYMDDRGINLLAAHLFMMNRGGEKPVEPDDERSILQVGGANIIYTDLIPKQVQYAALGHLHRYQTLGGGACPVVYSSSPLAYSFAEADQQKYVVVIEAEPGQPVQVLPVPLTSGKRLMKKSFAQISKLLEWTELNQDCYVEISMQTATYLSSAETRQIANSHPNIVSIVPDVRPTLPDPLFADVPDESQITAKSVTIDLSQPIDDLFVDYFKSKHKGQVPNEGLTTLFREILATEPTE